MACERLMLSMLYKCWERRIGSRLDASCMAFDPVEEINSHLLPNDHHEARPVFVHWPVISHRSLVRPFTPLSGLRLPTQGA